jgi:hypothetical protein
MGVRLVNLVDYLYRRWALPRDQPLLMDGAMRDWSWFRRKPKHSPDPFEGQDPGPGSPFATAALGHELRKTYDDLLIEPLPDDLQKVVEQLPDKPPGFVT